MLNWGIIGAGKIAVRFAKSLENFDNAQLYGVACRTIEKANAFKSMYPCQKVFDDYQELLDDDEIDLVYISLPHLYHYEWIIKAIKSGKSVLCEKPATLSREEMMNVAQAARENNVLFMEAMKSRFVPAYREMRKMILDGEIGSINKIQTTLCHKMSEDQATYHFLPKQGGALLDMGIYNISLIQDFSPKNLFVEEVNYVMHENNIDLYVEAKLIQDGFEAVVQTGFDRELEVKAIIYGTEGEIIIPNFHRPGEFAIFKNDNSISYQYPYDNDDFYSEIESFHHSHLNQEIENSIMKLEDSIQCANLIDLIKERIS